MSTTIYLGEEPDVQEVTLHAGSTYIVRFRHALHQERMVARFVEDAPDRLLFSLKPHGGVVVVDNVDLLRVEPALKGALVEAPVRVRWDE